MQVHVRPYEARDLDPIVDLSLRAWVPVYESFARVLGPEVFQRQYPDWRTSQRDEVVAACTEGKAHVWVAESGAEVVGFVAVVLEPEGGAGAVELLAVDPACQGQEVGTTLTEFATTWMKEAGVTLASIWTGGDPGHAPARRTYEKAGYTALPLVRYYKAL
ncbi:GNAT family N-acetyltransferase [Streptomyces cyaneofuscatus]|uniref:GNAT family N-acetyltransferase n=1 Tax=Streptomyces cyaneofuscatus TaxID=66883 RepID=A0ABZ1EZI3_9ACTN|nr:GNAT family N-acetyltransferase [Streptomyces cyaneofuscatus]WSB09435.1 GNAT family N-acetyltransferase [Streptomyces cyaneofuscatus]WSD47029.1 GNAT family N-acetyltransferase [Streptomyces cyaneofuscatus]WTA90431.1 GNAT family N-acetyltransferase [Streptomyces cyaneofuscatus]